MSNGEMTPKVALDVLQKLGALESLKMNLNDHMLVQEALKVMGALVAKQDSNPDQLKVV